MAIEDMRKTMNGWKAIQQGNKQTRQERIIQEQQERSQKIKNGESLNEADNGYKPGQDAGSEQFSTRKAKEFLQKMNEQKRAQKVFKGNADQCILKIATLMGSIQSDDPGRKYEKGKILLVEQAGFRSI